MIAPLRHTELLPGTLQNLFYPPLNYVYFARAVEVPFASAGAIAKAAWAADAAMLAYARYGRERMTDEALKASFARAGLDCVKIGGTRDDWNAPGTHAVFASCQDFAILAFRGTDKDDSSNTSSDLDLLLAHEPDYRPAAVDSAPALGHLSLVEHLFTEPTLVHRGFQLALNQVWDDVHNRVMAYRQKRPHSEVCVTGHSLGGALAVLAFSRFADVDMSLYTFGCPRVGNAAFRQRVLSNMGRGIYRYVNYNDAVAHVPLESLLYCQVPDTCYRFQADGCLVTDDGTFKGDIESLRAAIAGFPRSIHEGNLETIMAPPSVVDHSPARYCFRLWDCV